MLFVYEILIYYLSVSLNRQHWRLGLLQSCLIDREQSSSTSSRNFWLLQDTSANKQEPQETSPRAGGQKEVVVLYNPFGFALPTSFCFHCLCMEAPSWDIPEFPLKGYCTVPEIAVLRTVTRCSPHPGEFKFKLWKISTVWGKGMQHTTGRLEKEWVSCLEVWLGLWPGVKPQLGVKLDLASPGDGIDLLI